METVKAFYVLMAFSIAFGLIVGCKNGMDEIDVPANTVSGIAIYNPPAKTTYLMGEIIDFSGLEVNSIYSDGSTSLITDFTVSPVNTFRSGVFPVTISTSDGSSLTTAFEINVSKQLMDTGLPVIYIETKDAKPIASKENYVYMNLTIDADNGEHSLENTGFKDRIRGRGNDTWINYPKKPYRINFDKNTSLFGLTTARNWVLLANYKDSTLLSGTIAFELGHRFGFPFTNHYIHVELVLNGEYQGSYVLTEHSRVGAGRIEIDPDYGYLVEFSEEFDEDPKFMTPNLNLPAMITSPDHGTDINNPGYKFVIDSINEFDAALSASNFPHNNYRNLIDIDNFVDFIMINKIVLNDELNIPKSTFMYKDANEKIKMGPLWDFDSAFGLGPNTSIDLSTAQIRFWCGWLFERFFRDPEFMSRYRARWNEKYSDINAMSTFIDQMYNKLKVSASLNGRRWREDNYEEEINKLKTWWSRRVLYLNTEIY